MVTHPPVSSAGPTEEQLNHWLGGVTLGANLAGALLIFAYFTVLDPLPADTTPWRGVSGVGAGIFAGVLLLTFGLGIAYANRRFGPLLASYRGRIATGRTDSIPAALQRRALNYVPEVALLSLAMCCAWGSASTLAPPL